MTKLWIWPLAMLIGLALIGWHATELARADEPQFRLDEPFGLAGGQEVVLPAEGLRLRLADVLEDSRCPTQVKCFWTGQARVAIAVQPDGTGPTTTVEFNTNPAPGQTVKIANVAPYSVELQSLDPYPQTPAPIALEDYRATLVVRKS
jgi:hypothetical protein